MTYKELEPFSALMKPCPFCGAHEKYQIEIVEDRHADGWVSRFYAMCGRCAAHSASCATPEQALECWNKRVKE